MFRKESVGISLVQWFLAKNSINVLVDEDVLAYEKEIREKDTARRFQEFKRCSPTRGFLFSFWEKMFAIVLTIRYYKFVKLI